MEIGSLLNIGGFTSPLGNILFLVGRSVLSGLVIVLGLGLFAVVAWFIIRPYLYKMRVLVTRKRQGDTILVGIDWGRIVRTRNGLFGWYGPVILSRVHLLKRKTFIQTIPAPDFVYSDDRLGGGGTVCVTQFGDQDYAYTTLRVDATGVKLIPTDTDSQQWRLNEMKATRDRNKVLDNIQKYQVVIASVFVVIIIVAVLWWSKGTLTAVTSTSADAASQLARAFKDLNQCVVGGTP